LTGFLFAVKVIKKEELPEGISSLFWRRVIHIKRNPMIFIKRTIYLIVANAPQPCCFAIAVQRYSLFFILYIIEGYLSDFYRL